MVARAAQHGVSRKKIKYVFIRYAKNVAVFIFVFILSVYLFLKFKMCIKRVKV